MIKKIIILTIALMSIIVFAGRKTTSQTKYINKIKNRCLKEANETYDYYKKAQEGVIDLTPEQKEEMLYDPDMKKPPRQVLAEQQKICNCIEQRLIEKAKSGSSFDIKALYKALEQHDRVVEQELAKEAEVPKDIENTDPLVSLYMAATSTCSILGQ